MVSKANSCAQNSCRVALATGSQQATWKSPLYGKKRGGCPRVFRFTVPDWAARCCHCAVGCFYLLQCSESGSDGGRAPWKPTFGSHLLLQNVYYSSPWQLLLLESLLMQYREGRASGDRHVEMSVYEGPEAENKCISCTSATLCTLKYWLSDHIP